MLSTPPSSDSLPGKIAGRYRIEKLLGQGGFGAVYQAHDELEDQAVALKVIRHDATFDPRQTRSRSVESHISAERSSSAIRPSSTASASSAIQSRGATRAFGATPSSGSDVTEAFKDEFRLLTQLHHPNLAGVYEFGLCDEAEGVFFTQELVRGVYLTEFLRDASRETIVEIFVQLGRALDYIHTLGLVHEDIKPTNVLVTKNADGQPQAKLIDFGLARMFRNPRQVDLEDTSAVVVLGTPGFSAPEKVRGKLTDSRSDIYSLAATMYTAIRGTRPFPARDFKQALRAQRDWRPELAGSLLQQCGPVVAELIGRMLQPEPTDRPQSTRSIVLELLRREVAPIREHEKSSDERREFARVLVEHLPFVDRSGALELLLTRASEILLPAENTDPGASRSGSRSRLIRSIIIEAPEGMGKQRLMAELRREVQLGGGFFVQTSCWHTDSTVLGPFGPVVRQIASALGDRSSVVKEFADLVALARDKGSDELVGGKIMEFIVAAAARRPFVIHVSDLAQSPAELPRIEQLCRALEHSCAPVLLCATTVPHRKLVPLLGSLSKDQVAEVWNLRPFTSPEMRSILTGILGDGPAISDLVEMLDKLTGGHPLSFRETLRVLIEESILARDASGWNLRAASTAAEALHQTLAQRSESRLDGQGVSAWEIASVLYLIEAPIDEKQLASLVDVRRGRFERTLDRLEGEGLIVRAATSGSSLISLAHESVIQAVKQRYADSLDETRVDLATSIEELESPDPHLIFLRARLLDDAADRMESIDNLSDAADKLFEAGQAQLGAKVLERMIQRLRAFGGTEGLPRLLATKLKLLRQASGAIDDPRREAAHFEAGILVAELLQDFKAQSLFWLSLADRTRIDAGEDIDLILHRLDRAAQTATHADDRVLELRIANRRAEVMLGLGEIEQAGCYSRKAMEIVDLPTSSDVDVCHIIGVRLRCLALSGQLDDARQLHEMAKPIAARIRVAQRISYLSGVAYLAVLGEEPARGIPEIQMAVEQLRAANVQRLLIRPLHNLGDLSLRSGDMPSAVNAFSEAIRISSLLGLDTSVHLNRGFLGYSLARMGDPEEGAALLSEALDGMSKISSEQVSLQQLRLMDAEVAHLMGQSARARRQLEEMLADFNSSNEVTYAHQAQETLSRIERDLGASFIENPQEAEPASDPENDTVRTKPMR